MNALLPCPFCGRSPEVKSRKSDHTATGEFHTIACFCDGYCTKAWQDGETAEQAAERWNTRHTAGDAR